MSHRGSHASVLMSALPAASVRAALFGTPPATVILPFGSHEDHGPGVPMGDYRLAEAIAARIAERARTDGHPALVAPAVPFGGADFFSLVPGGLTLSPATLRAVIDDLLGGLVRQGVRRMLVVNGHGGSLGPLLDATRALRHAHGLLVPTLSIWKAGAALLRTQLGETDAAARLGHGADPVRSVSLALFPEQTQPAARPSATAPEIAGLPIASFSTLNLDGVEIDLPLESAEVAPEGLFGGDPSLADAATGAALVERLAGIGAALIGRLDALSAALQPGRM